MLNIALFVEGKTERIFIEKIIDEYFSHPFFNIDSFELIGDRARSVTKGHYKHPDVNISFLIYDVQGESKVLSAIKERAHGLVLKKFNYIIGLRDVYPAQIDDIQIINSTFEEIIVELGIEEVCSLFYAVMEIEAWFLSDPDLFSKIDNRLNIETINDNLNIEIENIDIEGINHPAETLNRIFQIIGRRYKKKEGDTHSLISRMDFLRLWLDDDVHLRIPSLKTFIDHLEVITKQN